MIRGLSEALSLIVGSIIISHMLYFGPQIHHHLEFERSVGTYLATSWPLQYTHTRTSVVLFLVPFRAQQVTANKL